MFSVYTLAADVLVCDMCVSMNALLICVIYLFNICHSPFPVPMAYSTGRSWYQLLVIYGCLATRCWFFGFFFQSWVCLFQVQVSFSALPAVSGCWDNRRSQMFSWPDSGLQRTDVVIVNGISAHCSSVVLLQVSTPGLFPDRTWLSTWFHYKFLGIAHLPLCCK